MRKRRNKPVCRNCGKVIPSHANFCPHCGIAKPLGGSPLELFAEFENKVEDYYKKIVSRLDKYAPDLSTKIQNVLDKLEERIISSKTPNFVNKARVLDALNKIRENLEKHYSTQAEEEARNFSSYVEQTISGDKCIICLNPFKIEDGARVEVFACPNCNYAGHREHFIAWLQEKNICPLCRAEISYNQLIKGYIMEKDNKLILVPSR